MTSEHRAYRAWFTPNPPRKAFAFETDTLTEAVAVLEAIADFSLELGETVIDTSAGEIEKWDGDDWSALDGDEGADEPGIEWAEGFDPEPRLREPESEALRALGQSAVMIYRQYLREQGITGMGRRP